MTPGKTGKTLLKERTRKNLSKSKSVCQKQNETRSSKSVAQEPLNQGGMRNSKYVNVMYRDIYIYTHIYIYHILASLNSHNHNQNDGPWWPQCVQPGHMLCARHRTAKKRVPS